MRKTGPTNQQLQQLIHELKRCSQENKAPIWKRIALELEKPTRQKKAVNMFKIEEVANDGDTIIVPGKVLATGELKKKVKVAAWSFSSQAEEKIKDKITIQELMKKNPQGTGVRIIL